MGNNMARQTMQRTTARVMKIAVGSSAKMAIGRPIIYVSNNENNDIARKRDSLNSEGSVFAL